MNEKSSCQELEMSWHSYQDTLSFGLPHQLYFIPYSMNPALYQRDINSLRPRQNGRYFADDIFKYIFLNENAWIPIKISLKFLP